MTLKEQIELMRNIAYKAHSNQFRRDGKTPYITHVQAVADGVEDRLKPIAYGHDLVEDTSVTLSELREYGFDSYIIDAIGLLTHEKHISNINYWKGIATNKDAVNVKLVDINHNLSSQPSEYAKQKYAKALEFFNNRV